MPKQDKTLTIYQSLRQLNEHSGKNKNYVPTENDLTLFGLFGAFSPYNPKIEKLLALPSRKAETNKTSGAKRKNK